MKLIKTMWGVDDCAHKDSWDRILGRIKADGFDGIEFCVGPLNCWKEDVPLFKQLVQKHGLVLVAQIHTCGYPVSSFKVEDHIASFKKLAHEAAAYQPIFINSHSGKDSFTREESIHFFEEAIKFEKEWLKPFKVYHETHRQRILYSALAYRDLMPHFPADLKLNADISHWVVVGERLMDENLDGNFWPVVLADLSKRVGFIHARVGYSQGPQVPDPFAPEYQKDVESHMRWWGAMVDSMRSRGVEVVMEPEFGAYPYQQHLPNANVPVVDLWAVVTKFGRSLRAAFDEKQVKK